MEERESQSRIGETTEGWRFLTPIWTLTVVKSNAMWSGWNAKHVMDVREEKIKTCIRGSVFWEGQGRNTDRYYHGMDTSSSPQTMMSTMLWSPILSRNSIVPSRLSDVQIAILMFRSFSLGMVMMMMMLLCYIIYSYSLVNNYWLPWKETCWDCFSLFLDVSYWNIL